MRFSSSASSSSSRSGWLASSSALHLLQQLEFAVELGVLDLLAVLVEALQALFDHHQVAEDQLGLHVLDVAHRVDRALLVRHGVVVEEAQHVGEGVDHAQAGQIAAGVAQSLLRDGGHVQVLDRGVGDLGRLEQLAPARPGARRAPWRCRCARRWSRCGVSWCTPVRIVNRDVLPTMGRPMMAVFIVRNDFYRGTSTWLRISSMMRSPMSARRCTRAARVLTTTRCAKSGTASRFTSSGMA